MKAGIAGVGGIGSNVAVNLVRSGITTLKLIDYDKVEASNLNRQFYFQDQIGKAKVEMLAENLLRINPDLQLESETKRLDRGNLQQSYQDCDVIIEGFDDSADKKMFMEVFCGDSRPIVFANGIAGFDLNDIKVRRLGNCYIVGDFITDCNDAPLYSHKISFIAARMSQIIIKHLMKSKGEDHEFNRR